MKTEVMTPEYYAVIPANVRFDKTLKAAEKLLYGEVSALAQKDGHAWANNRYFAELYGVTNETVSRWFSHLEKRGYIQIIPAQYGDNTPRKIIICAPQKAQIMRDAQDNQDQQSAQIIQADEDIQNAQGGRQDTQEGRQNKHRGMTKTSKRLDEKTASPMTESANRIIQENTLKNNTKNNKGDIFAPHTFSEPIQQVLSEWLCYKQERRESYRPTGLKCFLSEMEKKLSMYSEETVIDLVRLCMANGWKGIIWEKLRSNAPQQAQSGKEKNIFLEMLREE